MIFFYIYAAGALVYNATKMKKPTASSRVAAVSGRVRLSVVTLVMAVHLASHAGGLPPVPSVRSMRHGEGVCVLRGGALSDKSVAKAVDASIAPEGYKAVVSPDGIKVSASSDAGFFYAVRTLHQISESKNGQVVVPCCEIEDAPAFAWRGFMLDESRHFFGKAVVLSILERMADYKLNVLHWHLTDGNGWRIEVPKYPKLTTVGASRRVTRTRAQRFFRDVSTGRHGGFYTADDIREIVAFASSRHIRIVPEIEFPGHEGAAAAAYPELFCFGDGSKPVDPAARPRGDEICLASPFTFKFFADVLAEVSALFPGEFVHVGGDECTGRNWLACAKCRAKMKELCFSKPSEYQAWGIGRLHAILAGHGKRLIGWDPIFVPGTLPRDAAVMAYRGTRAGREAAALGHDAVMAPAGTCYLDFPQGLAGDPYEYQAFSNPVRVRDLYCFNPFFAVAAEARAHVLGGECPLWTEFVCTREELEWRIWPRLCALAEALWASPDPKTRGKTVEAFMSRLEMHVARLRADGVNAAPLGPLAPSAAELLPDVKHIEHREGLHPILSEKVQLTDVRFSEDASVPPGECDVAIDQMAIKAKVSDEPGKARALEIVRRIAEPKQGGVLSVRCGTFKTW